MSMDGDGFNLPAARIAIVGLGLMGGSLALALKGKCSVLLGVDPDPATRALALRREIVSQAEADPALILPQADVIILAAPVPAILTLLGRLPQLAPQPCVVLDLGSTKREIVAAMESLPERFDPLGGHPICGREQLSLGNADAALYRDAPFVLIALARTSAHARRCAEQVVEALSAHPLWLDAAAHDRMLAATSHLPYLLATALALATPAEAGPLIGPGFRSTSRLAATPGSMMQGVLGTNRDNVLEAVRRFQSELSTLVDALDEQDARTLSRLLAAAQERHSGFVQ
jgi:prephenate dehydrogenase